MGKMEDRIRESQRLRNGGLPASVIVKPAPTGAKSATREADGYDPKEWPKEDAPGPLASYEIHAAFRKFKYIIMLHPQLGEVALTFPSWVIHADMHERMYKSHRGPCVAAGFYEITLGDCEVTITPYGKSESLGIASRGKRDIDAIQRALGLEGY